MEKNYHGKPGFCSVCTRRIEMSVVDGKWWWSHVDLNYPNHEATPTSVD